MDRSDKVLVMQLIFHGPVCLMPSAGDSRKGVRLLPVKRRTVHSTDMPVFPSGGESAIESVNEEGFGVARSAGYEVWVPSAFPGERVAWRFSRMYEGKILAERLSILEPSPQRVRSQCPDAGICTGCPLLELDYSAQLALKEERVRKALDGGSGRTPAQVLPIQPADPVLGYRATAKLSVELTRQGPRVGLFRRGTQEVLGTTRCPTHHPLINVVAEAVRAELERLGVPVEDSRRGTGWLRHLVVRVSPSSGKAMVTLVVRRENEQITKQITKGLRRRVSEVVSVHQNLNERPGSQVFGRRTSLIWGYPDLLDQVGSSRVLLSPVSFFQAHHGQAAWIYDLVRRWAGLDGSKSALDLYCGVGGITMSLARDAGRVMGIEASVEATRDASRNAELNGLRNCRFRAADAANLDKVVAGREAFEVITLNPPRRGVQPEVLNQIVRLLPRRIIYVSCNPDSLAHDLAGLVKDGYRAVSAQPLDMFPHTAHVETVVLLQRAG
jgi:23S rRNA (uracil1939-C5)-methyltransferase